ncbi:MAG: hypothetical protein V7676_04775 [Parasphingorhabdus sp.]|uniref:hypothetical protein n=1 Tax=Parasphingorhabdus sp. TaxID=2709688 RepID=UPI0030012B38
MGNAASSPLYTLGLGGDGDEIAAIADVEKQFAVRLDYTSAGNWRTAGDVFSALRQEIPSGSRNDEEVWRRFAEAISRETGVDSHRVVASTLLLAKPISYRRLWLISAIAGLAAVAYNALA